MVTMMIRMRHKMNVVKCLVAGALALVVTTVHGHAASVWQVEMMSGEAYILSENAQPVALTPGGVVAAGGVIETGPDGRVVLSRGSESIVVSPNSSIAVSPESDSGIMTRILQRAGTVLLQVEKQDRQHFEVETPYLAAVVKGTKFTVSVDAEGAAVHVMEGVVETIDLDTGDVGLVRRGQTAQSLVGAGSGLLVSGPGAEPVQRGKDRARAQSTPRVAPKSVGEKGSPGQRVEIREEQRSPIDIADSTDGLARNAGANAAGGKRSDDDRDSGVDEESISHGAGSATAVASAPGQSGSAPGLSGSAPGQSGSAPGLLGSAPGQSGTAPGLAGTTPGQSGSAPGQSGGAPGKSGSAPGKSG